MQEKEVIIQILGRQYSMVSDREEEIRRLELYVNALLLRLQESHPDISYTKLLVLACMVLADEAAARRRTARDFLSSIEEEISQLILQSEKILSGRTCLEPAE